MPESAWTIALLIRSAFNLRGTARYSFCAVVPRPYSRLVPNPCRFCGATDRKITKEHIWPTWLRSYLPPMPAVGQVEQWSSGHDRRRRQQPLLSATVRRFCDVCNNGWMNRIEEAVRPIVGPMVTGRSMELDGAAQRVVANWVALKGLVAAQTGRGGQPIPDSHYRRVWTAQGAPANTMAVWIGQRTYRDMPGRRRPDVGFFDAHFMPVTDVFPEHPLPEPLEQYVTQGGVFNGTIFQVGQFFALALQHDWPALQGRVNPDSEAAEALLPVWPSGSTVLWPPPRSVDDLGNPHHMTRFLQIAPPMAPVYEP